MTTTNEDLIAEARMHALTTGPNMGICAADGVSDSALGRVLIDECQLVQRLADALAAVPAPTEADREALFETLFYEAPSNLRHVFKYADPHLKLEEDSYLPDMIPAILAAGFHRTPVPAHKAQGGGARDERDAKFFHDGWVAALKEVRKRGDRAVGEFLVEQLGEPADPEDATPVFQAMGLPPVPPFPSIHPEGGETK